MNRFLLLLFSLGVSIMSHSQNGFLFIKKGAKKKMTFTEGSPITLQLEDGIVLNGMITLLRNDTIFLNGFPIARASVKAVLFRVKKNKFPADFKTMALIGAGAALVTAGLTIDNRNSFKTALTAGLVIGYAPLLAKYFGRGLLLALKRKRYRFGKKYRLQVLEFHIPNKRAF